MAYGDCSGVEGAGKMSWWLLKAVFFVVGCFVFSAILWLTKSWFDNCCCKKKKK